MEGFNYYCVWQVRGEVDILSVLRACMAMRPGDAGQQGAQSGATGLG